MATAPSAPRKKQNPSLPPKRGQIKAQIFENLKESISSVASKAGEAFGKGKGKANGGGSASTTPPASAYTSDGYSDNA